MNTKRLSEILYECTTQFRNGEQVERTVVGGMEVIDVYAMDHKDTMPDTLTPVDVIFMTVGVHKPTAEAHKEEFVALCNELDPQIMQSGPSYITLGVILGSQDLALQFMAIGTVLGLWRMVTPRSLHVEHESLVRSMAAQGMVMITPYHRPVKIGGKDAIQV